jgi:lipopolysaccharide transport system permease protein
MQDLDIEEKFLMQHIKELYEYREMIISLVRKDLRGRYKGSVLGFLWTFVNPLLQLIVYTIVFSIIMRASYEQYYLFLFVALVPWMFFSSSVTDGAASILKEKDMVKRYTSQERFFQYQQLQVHLLI